MNTMSAGASKGEASILSDLAPRTLSAIVLIPIGLGAAYLGGPWIAGAAGAAALAMSYEWARMSEPDSLSPAFLFALVGSIGAVMFASWGLLAWGLGWIAGCAALSAVRRNTVIGVIETAGGAMYIGAPPALFVWLRGQEPGGFQFIIMIFAAIWAADVAAYFAGRLIGGPKLAPQLSPQKTWSGLIFGVIAGAAAGWGTSAYFGGVIQFWVFAGGLLALIGLAGDLFESYLKRRFNVKDASRIIPGHGGVLDRLDGCIAATIFVAILVGLWPRIAALVTASGS